MEPLLMSLLRTFPNRIVEHIYCEANKCIDALTKRGVQQTFCFLFFYNSIIESGESKS